MGHLVRLLIHKNGTRTTVTTPDEGSSSRDGVSCYNKEGTSKRHRPNCNRNGRSLTGKILNILFSDPVIY
ncbi:Hypothetical predicted protein [Pelobates cultripes]|uniref:Uncharacterized protein n=1 Tax=Pelobates cultripes TaxID=61616 RepID=A0AAD1WK74_PELCU|nr:Hypothetical predicted protein [Pelobates cultripes]